MGLLSRTFLLFFLHQWLTPTIRAVDNLRVAYQWKQLDFEYPSESARQEAIQSKEFIPENNLPLGLEVYRDRLFITVPRWKAGVAASLAYINLTDTSPSPKLKPYPNWEEHKIRPNEIPGIVSPFRVRADQCGRLWVLDTGVDDVMSKFNVLAPTRLLIYDLRRDFLLRSYTLPPSQVKKESFFANIAVEDHDCIETYAYLADLCEKPGIVVYSFKTGESWRVTHNFFHIDPLAGEFNVSGISFEWQDGIFGMGLSKADSQGYSTMYFHPLSSTNEFSVSTRILRNESLAKNSYHEFKDLGSRGTRGQSGPSFLDQKSDVLFYALMNLNAVACWRTTNPNYTMESQGRVYMSNETMVFPNDIKVDNQNNLWVLSDRLPTFMYRTLDPNDYNFRILTAKVSDAIRGTACDSKLVVNNKKTGKLNANEARSRNSADNFGQVPVFAVLVATTLVAILNL